MKNILEHLNESYSQSFSQEEIDLIAAAMKFANDNHFFNKRPYTYIDEDAWDELWYEVVHAASKEVAKRLDFNRPDLEDED